MKRILVGMFLQMVYTVFCLAESNIGVLQASHTGYSGAEMSINFGDGIY